jgi:hypothetical protein
MDDLKEMNEELSLQNIELDNICRTVDKLIQEVKMLTIAAVIIKDEVKQIKNGRRKLKKKLNE